VGERVYRCRGHDSGGSPQRSIRKRATTPRHRASSAVTARTSVDPRKRGACPLLHAYSARAGVSHSGHTSGNSAVTAWVTPTWTAPASRPVTNERALA
jgi:hypothetical protein